MALKLSGLAAKNFALFVYAVLKDQKKTRGKTRLVRMLKEQRPFKFFKIPAKCRKNFAKEAKAHGLLYVPIRNRKKSNEIEIVVFADDAAKIQRIYDNLGLDYVKAQTGEAAIEKPPEQKRRVPEKKEMSQMESQDTAWQNTSWEEDIDISSVEEEPSENFTLGREKSSGKVEDPSEIFLFSRDPFPAWDASESTPDQKPSVKKQLREIQQEQSEKKAIKRKRPERQTHVPRRFHAKKKQKSR